MLVSFYRPTRDKYKVLIEYSAFPSDHYAIASQVRIRGYNPKDAIIELKPSDGEIVTTEDISRIMSKHGSDVCVSFQNRRFLLVVRVILPTHLSKNDPQ